MAFKVELTPDAEKELDDLDPQAAKRILAFLFKRISKYKNPRQVGEALRGSRFKSLWRYKIGNYRVIVSIEDAESKILVLRIAHRREVYR